MYNKSHQDFFHISSNFPTCARFCKIHTHLNSYMNSIRWTHQYHLDHRRVHFPQKLPLLLSEFSDLWCPTENNQNRTTAAKLAAAGTSRCLGFLVYRCLKDFIHPGWCRTIVYPTRALILTKLAELPKLQVPVNKSIGNTWIHLVGKAHSQ